MVKINVLGLRGLRSMGMMDINKAMIKFEINSLLGKLNKYTIKQKAEILTLPYHEGSNPNIQTIIRFDI